MHNDIERRIVLAVAKRHGWSQKQIDAALAATANLPASLPVAGKPHLMAPVPIYDIAVKAAENAR